jgi:hypothetical protein
MLAGTPRAVRQEIDAQIAYLARGKGMPLRNMAPSPSKSVAYKLRLAARHGRQAAITVKSGQQITGEVERIVREREPTFQLRSKSPFIGIAIHDIIDAAGANDFY